LAYPPPPPPTLLPLYRDVKGFRLTVRIQRSEPLFLNVYGAQESIPRNEFRQSI
jgi:hypothetical protein